MSEPHLENQPVQLPWQYWVTYMGYLVFIAVLGIIISRRILTVTEIDSRYGGLIYLSVYSILLCIGYKKRMNHLAVSN